MVRQRNKSLFTKPSFLNIKKGGIAVNNILTEASFLK